jgi:glutamate--cysteine ligase
VLALLTDICNNAASKTSRVRCRAIAVSIPQGIRPLGVNLVTLFTDSLAHYSLPEFDPSWRAIKRGIEKESLRISPTGDISTKTHPAALGSALKNPFVTTDFSEALLEFITPAYEDIDECLKVLENTHRFTIQNLSDNELLWVASMPCPLGDELDIPIAQYGSSNVGKLKTLYRHGLSNRYGRLMQVIAGIHYNFSMPKDFWAPYQKICGDNGSLQDFVTQKYLHLIRNFHRNSWLLIYLFGASPAACKCFVQGREHNLQELDSGSLFLPNATCLRMGNLGYKSDAQKSLFVCYNELDTYAECLSDAMHTPYPEYETLGQKRDGEYLQLNTNLLQLENEFYSTIRPKRVVQSGERPLDALTSKGIEYVEVRLLDLNPYLPLGIDAQQTRFLDAFLLHCLLDESPHCDEREFFEVSQNITKVVENGRDPNLELIKASKPHKLVDWAQELLDGVAFSSALLDGDDSNLHEESRLAQLAKLRDPSLTPSGMMLNDMQKNGQSFFKFSMQQSKVQQEYLSEGGIDQQAKTLMEKTAKDSIIEQASIEAADTMDFDEYLRRWNQT